MQLKGWGAALLVSLTLGACAGRTPDPQLAVRTQRVAGAQVPVIQPLPKAELQPFEWSFPADSRLLKVAKTTPECRRVAAADRDDAYWARCGTVGDPKSQIYIGLTYDNYQRFLHNWEVLSRRERLYANKISTANRNIRAVNDSNDALVGEDIPDAVQ